MAQNPDQNIQRGVIRVRTLWQVIERANQLHIADPAQHHVALPVLDGFRGIGGREHALGPRNRAKMLLHHVQSGGFVELAGNDQNRVVRLVVGFVECPQALYRYVFDVRTRAYGGAPIVMPLVGGGGDSLAQYTHGTVLAGFELVSDHRHFRVQILLRYMRVDHAVRLQGERPIQVVGARGQSLVIIGAVVGGGAVELGATLLQQSQDIGKSRCPLE